MEYYTRLSKPFLCYAVPEVCAAVYDALKDEYLKPDREQDDRDDAEDVESPTSRDEFISNCLRTPSVITWIIFHFVS
ncbi:hypothetical protein ANN_28243 [Periplaneta americana]|uniref:Uncharacterized protein n=1 Tax=Periplaneta americana TaxID=6978 RepID=A0ABQ8RU64_PERAM|nr:hypothetical protein ANN_28243 [Periplaneta americana]